MNRLNIIFAALVLMISGYAFATTAEHLTNAPITSIKYNKDTMIVRVSGQLPNRCVASPKPVLIATENPKVLVLGVAGIQLSDTCIDMIGGHYDLAFDIRSLKFDLADMNLDVNGTYTIISRDGSLAVDVDFSKSTFTKSFETAEVAGGMFAVENGGKYVVVVSDKEAFHLNSPFIDMSKYAGQTVEVQGHELKAQAPVLGGDSTTAQNTILVTGINTTTF